MALAETVSFSKGITVVVQFTKRFPGPLGALEKLAKKWFGYQSAALWCYCALTNALRITIEPVFQKRVELRDVGAR